jgi:predicted transcriptional regulator
LVTPNFAAEPSLNQADLRRLEKLAAAAGRSPRAMLKFVLRDGFAETEQLVQAVLAGRADVTTGRAYPHAVIMRKLDDVLSRHGGRRDHLEAGKSQSNDGQSLRIPAP